MQDRIKQMAVEAGADEAIEGLFYFSDENIARFARLVAEDCAGIAECNWGRLKATERAHYAQTNQPFIPEHFGFSSIDAEGHNIAQAIRARYT